MMIKKFGALLLSAVLCIGMAAPAFAYGDDTAPVEQPVLEEVVEEDVVTITDESTGALTPEGNLTLVELPHQLFGRLRAAVHHAGIEIGSDILSGD